MNMKENNIDYKLKLLKVKRHDKKKLQKKM